MSDELPVYVQIRRPDGSFDKVRVGSAMQSSEGFILSLGELIVSRTPDASSSFRRAAAPAPASAGGGGGGTGGAVFPNYGTSKGQPVAGAALRDLEFYANGCRRSLNDPSKSRWHEKEKVLLAAIEAEIARQRGGEDGGGGGAGSGGGGFGDEPPPHDDGDAPF